MYSITDELKSDKDIFEYIKNKFVFTEDDSYRVHASGIVETYGSACGKCNTNETIRQALNEVIAFSSEHSLIAYWIFYGEMIRLLDVSSDECIKKNGIWLLMMIFFQLVYIMFF